MGAMTESKRQLVWVYDLNKCIGCQTCSVACKVLWTHEEEGAEHQWWMTVNTQPGAGTPKDWEKMGGGYDGGGSFSWGSFRRRRSLEAAGTTTTTRCFVGVVVVRCTCRRRRAARAGG